MKCGNCGQIAGVNVEHVKNCQAVKTVEDVERLLLSPAPGFEDLLDGIAIAKRERRSDIRDRCIQFAIASVTGETPDRKVRNLALEAAVRFLEDASEESLNDDLENARSALQSLGEPPRVL